MLDLPAEVRQDPQRLRDADSGRDGCRVPLPWTREHGWRSPWLPIPADWAELSVEAQEGVTGSTLELYRAALRLRSAFSGDLTWHESPEGTLVFSRGSLVCAVNLTGTPVDFGVDGELLLASDVPGAGDSAAWWKVKCEASTTTG